MDIFTPLYCVVVALKTVIACLVVVYRHCSTQRLLLSVITLTQQSKLDSVLCSESECAILLNEGTLEESSQDVN